MDAKQLNSKLSFQPRAEQYFQQFGGDHGMYKCLCTVYVGGNSVIGHQAHLPSERIFAK